SPISALCPCGSQCLRPYRRSSSTPASVLPPAHRTLMATMLTDMTSRMPQLVPSTPRLRSRRSELPLSPPQLVYGAYAAPAVAAYAAPAVAAYAAPAVALRRLSFDWPCSLREVLPPQCLMDVWLTEDTPPCGLRRFSDTEQPTVWGYGAGFTVLDSGKAIL
ncbi:hypothetical protein CEXT_436671, partial [Caerostris extrusa]